MTKARHGVSPRAASWSDDWEDTPEWSQKPAASPRPARHSAAQTSWRDSLSSTTWALVAIVGIFVVACLVFGVTILSGWAAGGHSETYSSVLADSSSGALSLDSLPASGLGASGTSLARSAQLSELVDGQEALPGGAAAVKAAAAASEGSSLPVHHHQSTQPEQTQSGSALSQPLPQKQHKRAKAGRKAAPRLSDPQELTSWTVPALKLPAEAEETSSGTSAGSDQNIPHWTAANTEQPAHSSLSHLSGGLHQAAGRQVPWQVEKGAAGSLSKGLQQQQRERPVHDAGGQQGWGITQPQLQQPQQAGATAQQVAAATELPLSQAVLQGQLAQQAADAQAARAEEDQAVVDQKQLDLQAAAQQAAQAAAGQGGAQVGPGADSKPGRRSRVRPSSSAAAGLQAAQASDLPLAGLTVSGTGQQAAAGEQTSYAASLQAARQEQQQQAAGSTDLPLAGLTVSGAGQQGAAGEQSTGAASADLLQPQPGDAGLLGLAEQQRLDEITVGEAEELIAEALAEDELAELALALAPAPSPGGPAPEADDQLHVEDLLGYGLRRGVAASGLLLGLREAPAQAPGTAPSIASGAAALLTAASQAPPAEQLAPAPLQGTFSSLRREVAALLARITLPAPPPVQAPDTPELLLPEATAGEASSSQASSDPAGAQGAQNISLLGTSFLASAGNGSLLPEPAEQAGAGAAAAEAASSGAALQPGASAVGSEDQAAAGTAAEGVLGTAAAASAAGQQAAEQAPPEAPTQAGGDSSAGTAAEGQQAAEQPMQQAAEGSAQQAGSAAAAAGQQEHLQQEQAPPVHVPQARQGSRVWAAARGLPREAAPAAAGQQAAGSGQQAVDSSNGEAAAGLLPEGGTAGAEQQPVGESQPAASSGQQESGATPGAASGAASGQQAVAQSSAAGAVESEGELQSLLDRRAGLQTEHVEDTGATDGSDRRNDAEAELLAQISLSQA